MKISSIKSQSTKNKKFNKNNSFNKNKKKKMTKL